MIIDDKIVPLRCVYVFNLLQNSQGENVDAKCVIGTVSLVHVSFNIYN